MAQTFADASECTEVDATRAPTREIDELRFYLSEAVRYPLLTAQSERALARALRDARSARDRSSGQQALGATTSPSAPTFEREKSETVRDLVASLPVRKQLIVRMRYGVGFNSDHTLEQIGTVLNLTRERVRQLEKEAFSELRSHSQHLIPADLLGTGR